MGSTIQFFIGKGGVGKSTTSALTALKLAQMGHNTLLVSMDPAHNQGDIFQNQFSEKPTVVVRNLAVKEVDLDFWMKTYLKDTQARLKKAYSYQSAFSIQNYYNILKYSPGLEEYALLLAFENILDTEKKRDHIVFDMPPTALTMRFFSLPSIALIWLKELLTLRAQIYAKKKIVSKIQFGKREIEQDKVSAQLASMIDDHRILHQHFTTNDTRINLVLNNDKLSFSEAIRIRRKLADIGIDISGVMINKVNSDLPMANIASQFNGHPTTRFPISTDALCGLESLNKYIQETDLFSRRSDENLLHAKEG
jgi:arsenite-transporting ATPase